MYFSRLPALVLWQQVHFGYFCSIHTTPLTPLTVSMVAESSKPPRTGSKLACACVETGSNVNPFIAPNVQRPVTSDVHLNSIIHDKRRFELKSAFLVSRGGAGVYARHVLVFAGRVRPFQPLGVDIHCAVILQQYLVRLGTGNCKLEKTERTQLQ